MSLTASAQFKFATTVEVGDPLRSMSQLYTPSFTIRKIKITKLDHGCVVVVNPASEDDVRGDVSLSAVPEACLIMPRGSTHSYGSPLPVDLFDGIGEIRCTCPSAKYAVIEVYE